MAFYFATIFLISQVAAHFHGAGGRSEQHYTGGDKWMANLAVGVQGRKSCTGFKPVSPKSIRAGSQETFKLSGSALHRYF